MKLQSRVLIETDCEVGRQQMLRSELCHFVQSFDEFRLLPRAPGYANTTLGESAEVHGSRGTLRIPY
eukprot:4387438-Amphidinium_carterae.1